MSTSWLIKPMILS